MEKLYSLVDVLKESLDDDKDIKDIKFIQSEIENDQELLQLINEYSEYKNPKLKKQIIENEKFIRYKKLENKINYKILSINKSLSELKSKDNEE